MSANYEAVRKVLREYSGVEDSLISPEAKLIDDLNLDSLDLVEFVMELEEKLDIEIRNDDADKWITVDDIAKFLDEVNPVKPH